MKNVSILRYNLGMDPLPHTAEWLLTFASSHAYIVYAVIALVSFIEGPILGMICGLLIKLGGLSFWPVYIALMFGDLIGDAFWYGIGYKFGHRFIRRFGRFFSVTESGFQTVEHIFHKYKDHILLISKATMGLGFALVTLITAGIVRIPFGRYMVINFFGQFVWTGFLLIVGYFLGHLYILVDNVLWRLSILALIVVVFAALIGYAKYVRRYISKKLS